MRGKALFLAAVTAMLLPVSGICGGGANSVTTAGSQVLGSASTKNAQAWAASTAYSNGVLVRANGRVGLSLGIGTTDTTAPTFVSDDVTDNGIVWRPVLSRERTGMFLHNLAASDSATTFSWYGATATSNGIVLFPGDSIVYGGVDDTPQSAVFATASSGTNDIVVSEW